MKNTQYILANQKRGKNVLKTWLKPTYHLYTFVILAFLFLGFGNAWAYETNLYLIGNYTGDNWSENQTNYQLTGSWGSGKFFIAVYHDGSSSKYFKIYTNNSVGPNDDNNVALTTSGYDSPVYNKSGAWYISGTNANKKGIIIISADQNNSKDWNPKVWWDRAKVRLKHQWSSDTWEYNDADMTDNMDGTYYLHKNFPSRSGGYNYGVYSSTSSYDAGYISSPSILGSPTSGNKCQYDLNTNTGSLTITKLCNVTYNGNSSTGGTVPSADEDNLYTSTITLSSNVLTKAGYTHSGWNTNADGTGTHYALGAEINPSTTSLSGSGVTTLELYAEWQPQSLTITAHPTYLSTTDKLTLSISYENIPTGYCYRVKVGAGYYNNSSDQDRDAISGTGSTTFTSFSALPLGANTVVVELWKNDPFAAQSVVSNSVTVTVENRYFVNVRAYTDGIESTAGGTVSPESLYATAHLGQTITASAPNVGYNFTGWTADTDNITFADESALSTTVYAAAGGWVRANYVRQSGSYSTTFYAGDHGSIHVIDTDIAKNGNATVTTGEDEELSATPEEGYIFDHWGTIGSVTVTDIYAATTTVTATAAGGTVTAYYRHRPELGAVTATPSGQQNYAGSPINFELSVTSTYMAHPVVVFLVNDGTTTYEVVGAPYGADGSSAAGTIGSDAANTTVHKATFTASAAKTYTVSAKLYEGELMDNFEGENTRGWAGDNLGSGFISFADNPGKMAGNGSNKVLQVTRTSGEEWGGAIMLFVANTTEAKTTCDAAGSNDYAYIHACMKNATDATHLKNNDAAGNTDDINPTFVGATSSDWRHVTYHNTHCSNNFLYFMIQRGNTDNKTVYIDDIILSNEETMTEKASQAATASFSINWDYTVTLNNNGATSAGTESVDVTYGSSKGISNITVPTKTGYTFRGYYTADAGAGTLQIDASGVWQNGGYVSEGKWNSGSDQTLYAKWGENPTITGLTLSKSLVTTGNTFTATPAINAGDGRTTIICWEVQTAAGVKLDPQPTITPGAGNAVTITASITPGSYKVVATLREGSVCNSGTVLDTEERSFTVEGSYTVTITNGSGDSSVGEVTTATATADAAEEGMKFDHWEVTGTYTLQGGTTTSSRVIQFTASSNISLTAVYTERDTKTVYFARPSSWTDGLKVYAWEEASKDGGGNPSDKNAAWPGEACTSTTTIEGTTYYYYTFFIDDNGEGDDKTAQNSWDKIIFSDNGNASEKTADLTLVDAHYYHVDDGKAADDRGGKETATVAGSASPADWYVTGYFNGANDWGYAHPIIISSNTGSTTVGSLTTSTTQYVKIYRASTNQWFKWTGGASVDHYEDKEAEIGTEMVMREYNHGSNYFTSTLNEYRFSLDVTSTANPKLTISPAADNDYSVTIAVNGHGSITQGTGAKTIHTYAPTTLTATAEPGYRFTGWTVDDGHNSYVSFSPNSSSSSVTVFGTSGAAGATITANFSNSEVIYFDASSVISLWGDKVYVTFFSQNFDWDGTTGALIVKDYVSNALRCVEMTRIPNSKIYYLDYSNLDRHEYVQEYVLFTSKYFDVPGSGYYKLFEMAAVTRGDYDKNTTNNLFVAENWIEKDKNKTGYYCGYWMNYKQTDPGVYLDIHDGESLLPGIPNFQLIDGRENEYTATFNLSGNNTYSLGLRGANGTYYNNDNSGTMTSSDCTGWPYVDRQKTPGHILTTADGDYKFTLTCGDKLTLSVEYPLSVGDYRIVYSGALEDTTSAPVHTHHSSRIIRQLPVGVSERKDTISFFVTGDWSIKLQRCSTVTPNITWVDACGSATQDAADLGLSGKTGTYIFPLTLSSTGAACDHITVGTPELYTGDYYIRTDVAKGGWEGYERSLNSRMTFSEYARDHSGFDYYNCQYAQTNKNVKFTIANDYSFCVTDTLEGDAYVPKTGGNKGKLPYQANIRFMFNSARNTISRAYLNGSSETGANTFLYLQSTSADGQPDIYKSDGAALTADTIRFRDHNNWIYQIDVQANEQARVKLISNYRFSDTDHLQYFKGAAGDWSTATTSEIVGGNYAAHPDAQHYLRIIYDFKTNRLLSAWLVPESGSVPAAAINTDVMIIKQDQDDARQITFSAGSALTEVDTVYTAVLLTKDFLTGDVASDYAKQFYWLSFPYTVKLNDVFGSVGTYGYDWIMQRYNGKKRAANGFWADSEPNWEFMDRSETLNPYEGYILTLDLSEFTASSEKWKNSVTTLSLYFPSDSKVGNIKQTSVTYSYDDQDDYRCPHTRDRRDIKDSYWRCIGSPSFADKAIGGWSSHNESDWETSDLPFLYQWNSTTNQLSPVSAGEFTFKPLTGYMVQYSGATLTWTSVITPSASAPGRTRMAGEEERLFRLHLVQGEEEADHTYIRFTADDHTTEAFDFNQDLSKEFQSGANIYTLTADSIQVAGNTLPVSTQTTIVPVGVKIKTAGDYTFSIPAGTDGIGVTLIDCLSGVRTSLSAMDYTVCLTPGTYDQRFVLEFSPIYHTPTDIEAVRDQHSAVRKVMIDGILYIVRDGKLFNACGALVR